jgi:hypothetical protein
MIMNQVGCKVTRVNNKLDAEDISSTGTIRQPLLRLTGHTGAVIAADWLCTGNQVCVCMSVVRTRVATGDHRLMGPYGEHLRR